jgi:hypothetical protein
MDGSYYFSQGRLISTYPYSKYADNMDKNYNMDSDTNKDKENKDKNDWMKIFNGYKFQIFSPSILRYK